MKIAINCWVLRNKQIDGIGYFTINTISRLIKNHPETEFLLLCSKNFTEDYFDFPNAKKHFIFPALRHPVLYLFYLEFILPFFLKKHRPDLFLSAEGFLSLLSSCPQVPIIYDINFEHYPKDLKWYNRLYFGTFFKKFARKAKRIVTISEYSKQDIVTHYKIAPDKIDNVSCGINGDFRVIGESEKITQLNKWSGGVPYFFFVGSMHPRKNINRLIAAFSLFKTETGAPHKLILAGNILWSKSEIENTYLESPYKADIIFAGRLSDKDLQQTLAAAFALSFVPIFEGFGLPIVEAMQCGVPVICANVTSMPEVAGDAAILVDPFSIDSIAAGMEKLYLDPALQKELINKGFLQKQKFSWDKTATLLWESLMRSTLKS